MAEGRSTQKRSSQRPKATTQSRPAKGAAEVARTAAEQLHDLTGREIEGVTGVERDDDGWRIRIEVLESRRIPDSADILALYETRSDASGEVVEYRRIRRYGRGRTGDD